MGATLLCSVCFRSPTIVQLTPTYSWFIIWEFSICGFFCGKSNVGCIQWLRGGGRNTQKDSQKLVILIFLNVFFYFFIMTVLSPPPGVPFFSCLWHTTVVNMMLSLSFSLTTSNICFHLYIHQFPHILASSFRVAIGWSISQRMAGKVSC